MAGHAAATVPWFPSSYPSVNFMFDLDDALTVPVADLPLVKEVELPTATEEDVNDVVCSICTEGFRTGGGDGKRVPCGHVYHSDCITTWLSRCNSCPLCRAQFCVLAIIMSSNLNIFLKSVFPSPVKRGGGGTAEIGSGRSFDSTKTEAGAEVRQKERKKIGAPLEGVRVVWMEREITEAGEIRRLSPLFRRS